MHARGIAQSGDVSIFYRLFGGSGGTPLLILHGSSYYDSFDWIGIAERLATTRQVAAMDMRGYGKSGWSPSKDYTHQAQLQDIASVLDNLGWPKAALLGHSRGGAYATLFCARRPDRATRLITVDYCPGIGTRGGGPVVTEQKIGQKPKVFATLEDAVSKGMSRHANLTPGSVDRRRLETILQKVDGGFIIGLRDPDYTNPIPTTAGPDWAPSIPIAVDMWAEMAKVTVPVLAFRGLRSVVFSPEAAERYRKAFPNILLVELDSGHDIMAEAPNVLITRSEEFLTEVS